MDVEHAGMVFLMNRIIIAFDSGDRQENKRRLEEALKPVSFQLRLVHPDNNTLTAQGKEQVDGYTLQAYQFDNVDGKPAIENLWLADRPVLTEQEIKTAKIDDQQLWHVHVELTQEGALAMKRATSSMARGKDRLAIVIDNRVISAPIVQSILSGQFEISGLDAKTHSGLQFIKAIKAASLGPRYKLIEEREER